MKCLDPQKVRQFGNGCLPTLDEADIGIALRCLSGEEVGAQPGKALKAFKHIFASSDRHGAACETYVTGLPERLPR